MDKTRDGDVLASEDAHKVQKVGIRERGPGVALNLHESVLSDLNLPAEDCMDFTNFTGQGPGISARMDANYSLDSVTISWGDVMDDFLLQISSVFRLADKKAFFDWNNVASEFAIMRAPHSEQNKLRTLKKRDRMIEGLKEKWYSLFLLDAIRFATNPSDILPLVKGMDDRTPVNRCSTQNLKYYHQVSSFSTIADGKSPFFEDSTTPPWDPETVDSNDTAAVKVALISALKKDKDSPDPPLSLYGGAETPIAERDATLNCPLTDRMKERSFNQHLALQISIWNCYAREVQKLQDMREENCQPPISEFPPCKVDMSTDIGLHYSSYENVRDYLLWTFRTQFMRSKGVPVQDDFVGLGPIARKARAEELDASAKEGREGKGNSGVQSWRLPCGWLALEDNCGRYFYARQTSGSKPIVQWDPPNEVELAPLRLPRQIFINRKDMTEDYLYQHMFEKNDRWLRKVIELCGNSVNYNVKDAHVQNYVPRYKFFASGPGSGNNNNAFVMRESTVSSTKVRTGQVSLQPVNPDDPVGALLQDGLPQFQALRDIRDLVGNTLSHVLHLHKNSMYWSAPESEGVSSSDPSEPVKRTIRPLKFSTHYGVVVQNLLRSHKDAKLFGKKSHGSRPIHLGGTGIKGNNMRERITAPSGSPSRPMSPPAGKQVTAFRGRPASQMQTQMQSSVLNGPQLDESFISIPENAGIGAGCSSDSDESIVQLPTKQDQKKALKKLKDDKAQAQQLQQPLKKKKPQLEVPPGFTVVYKPGGGGGGGKQIIVPTDGSAKHVDVQPEIYSKTDKKKLSKAGRAALKAKERLDAIKQYYQVYNLEDPDGEEAANNNPVIANTVDRSRLQVQENEFAGPVRQEDDEGMYPDNQWARGSGCGATMRLAALAVGADSLFPTKVSDPRMPTLPISALASFGTPPHCSASAIGPHLQHSSPEALALAIQRGDYLGASREKESAEEITEEAELIMDASLAVRNWADFSGSLRRSLRAASTAVMNPDQQRMMGEILQARRLSKRMGAFGKIPDEAVSTNIKFHRRQNLDKRSVLRRPGKLRSSQKNMGLDTARTTLLRIMKKGSELPRNSKTGYFDIYEAGREIGVHFNASSTIGPTVDTSPTKRARSRKLVDSQLRKRLGVARDEVVGTCPTSTFERAVQPMGVRAGDSRHYGPCSWCQVLFPSMKDFKLHTLAMPCQQSDPEETEDFSDDDDEESGKWDDKDNNIGSDRLDEGVFFRKDLPAPPQFSLPRWAYASDPLLFTTVLPLPEGVEQVQQKAAEVYYDSSARFQLPASAKKGSDEASALLYLCEKAFYAIAAHAHAISESEQSQTNKPPVLSADLEMELPSLQLVNELQSSVGGGQEFQSRLEYAILRIKSEYVLLQQVTLSPHDFLQTHDMFSRERNSLKNVHISAPNLATTLRNQYTEKLERAAAAQDLLCPSYGYGFSGKRRSDAFSSAARRKIDPLEVSKRQRWEERKWLLMLKDLPSLMAFKHTLQHLQAMYSDLNLDNLDSNTEGEEMARTGVCRPCDVLKLRPCASNMLIVIRYVDALVTSSRGPAVSERNAELSNTMRACVLKKVLPQYLGVEISQISQKQNSDSSPLGSGLSADTPLPVQEVDMRNGYVRITDLDIPELSRKAALSEGLQAMTINSLSVSLHVDGHGLAEEQADYSSDDSEEYNYADREIFAAVLGEGHRIRGEKPPTGFRYSRVFDRDSAEIESRNRTHIARSTSPTSTATGIDECKEGTELDGADGMSVVSGSGVISVDTSGTGSKEEEEEGEQEQVEMETDAEIEAKAKEASPSEMAMSDSDREEDVNTDAGEDVLVRRSTRQPRKTVLGGFVSGTSALKKKPINTKADANTTTAVYRTLASEKIEQKKKDHEEQVAIKAYKETQKAIKLAEKSPSKQKTLRKIKKPASTSASASASAQPDQQDYRVANLAIAAAEHAAERYFEAGIKGFAYITDDDDDDDDDEDDASVGFDQEPQPRQQPREQNKPPLRIYWSRIVELYRQTFLWHRQQEHNYILRSCDLPGVRGFFDFTTNLTNVKAEGTTSGTTEKRMGADAKASTNVSSSASNSAEMDISDQTARLSDSGPGATAIATEAPKKIKEVPLPSGTGSGGNSGYTTVHVSTEDLATHYRPHWVDTMLLDCVVYRLAMVEHPTTIAHPVRSHRPPASQAENCLAIGEVGEADGGKKGVRRPQEASVVYAQNGNQLSADKRKKSDLTNVAGALPQYYTHNKSISNTQPTSTSSGGERPGVWSNWKTHPHEVFSNCVWVAAIESYLLTHGLTITEQQWRSRSKEFQDIVLGIRNGPRVQIDVSSALVLKGVWQWDEFETIKNAGAVSIVSAVARSPAMPVEPVGSSNMSRVQIQQMQQLRQFQLDGGLAGGIATSPASKPTASSSSVPIAQGTPMSVDSSTPPTPGTPGLASVKTEKTDTDTDTDKVGNDNTMDAVPFFVPVAAASSAGAATAANDSMPALPAGGGDYVQKRLQRLNPKHAVAYSAFENVIRNRVSSEDKKRAVVETLCARDALREMDSLSKAISSLNELPALGRQEQGQEQSSANSVQMQVDNTEMSSTANHTIIPETRTKSTSLKGLNVHAGRNFGNGNPHNPSQPGWWDKLLREDDSIDMQEVMAVGVNAVLSMDNPEEPVMFLGLSNIPEVVSAARIKRQEQNQRRIFEDIFHGESPRAVYQAALNLAKEQASLAYDVAYSEDDEPRGKRVGKRAYTKSKKGKRAGRPRNDSYEEGEGDDGEEVENAYRKGSGRPFGANTKSEYDPELYVKPYLNTGTHRSRGVRGVYGGNNEVVERSGNHPLKRGPGRPPKRPAGELPSDDEEGKPLERATSRTGVDFQAFVPPMLSMLPSDVLAALPAFDRSVGYESTEMSREVNPLGSVGNTEDGTKIYKKRLKLEKERNGADTIGTRGVRAEEQIREDTTAMATAWEDSKPTVATIAILLEAATVQTEVFSSPSNVVIPEEGPHVMRMVAGQKERSLVKHRRNKIDKIIRARMDSKFYRKREREKQERIEKMSNMNAQGQVPSGNTSENDNASDVDGDDDDSVSSCSSTEIERDLLLGDLRVAGKGYSRYQKITAKRVPREMKENGEYESSSSSEEEEKVKRGPGRPRKKGNEKGQLVT